MDAMNGATMISARRENSLLCAFPAARSRRVARPSPAHAPHCPTTAGILACHRVVRLSCARLSPNCPPAPALCRTFLRRHVFLSSHLPRLSSQHRSIVLPACRQSDSLCACGRLDRQTQAPVAQLDRALPSEGKGQRFESPRARHNFNDLANSVPSFASGKLTKNSPIKASVLAHDRRRTPPGGVQPFGPWAGFWRPGRGLPGGNSQGSRGNNV